MSKDAQCRLCERTASELNFQSYAPGGAGTQRVTAAAPAQQHPDTVTPAREGHREH